MARSSVSPPRFSRDLFVSRKEICESLLFCWVKIWNFQQNTRIFVETNKQMKTSDNTEARILELLEVAMTSLSSAGISFKKSICRSNGLSCYLTIDGLVHAGDYAGFPVKCRISDHSVTNPTRILTESHICDVDGIAKFTQYCERNLFPHKYVSAPYCDLAKKQESIIEKSKYNGFDNEISVEYFTSKKGREMVKVVRCLEGVNFIKK